mgnify:CR=1 FL=1
MVMLPHIHTNQHRQNPIKKDDMLVWFVRVCFPGRFGEGKTVFFACPVSVLEGFSFFELFYLEGDFTSILVPKWSRNLDKKYAFAGNSH